MCSGGAAEAPAPAPAGLLLAQGQPEAPSAEGEGRPWARSEQVRQDPALLRWCQEQCRRAVLTYKKEPQVFLADGSFPQWACQGNSDSLLALGRVRQAGSGEEAFAGVIEVAFRGTENNDNWTTNLKVAMVDNALGAKEGRIHQGFCEAYLALRTSMLEHIAVGFAKLNLAFGADVLVLSTGHSLGGALATLAAYDLASQGCSAACVTFGSPRVGDEAFVRSYQAVVGRTLRFINKFDQVPRLPPSASEALANDADLLHHGASTLLSAIGLTGRVGAQGYVHVGPSTQLDACGVSSSIDHFANLAIAAGQKLQARQAAAAGIAAAAAPAEAVDLESVVPHAITIYERNLANLLGGNEKGKAAVGMAVATAAARFGSLLSSVQAARAASAAAAVAAPAAAAAQGGGSSPAQHPSPTARAAAGPPTTSAASTAAPAAAAPAAASRSAASTPTTTPTTTPTSSRAFAPPARASGFAAFATLAGQALAAAAAAQAPPAAAAQRKA